MTLDSSLLFGQKTFVNELFLTSGDVSDTCVYRISQEERSLIKLDSCFSFLKGIPDTLSQLTTVLSDAIESMISSVSNSMSI